MENQNTISRNSFIRIVAGLIFGVLVWIWYKLTNFQTERENNIEFRHSEDISMGISYFEKYYLYRADHSIKSYLTKCTHAGCRIGVSSGTILQCNCHGSQFDAETGKPLKGPAIRPLQEIECRFDETKGQWVVSLRPMGKVGA